MDMTLDEQSLKQLFDSSRDAVAALKDNRIFYLNPPAKRLGVLHCGMETDVLFPHGELSPDCSRAESTLCLDGQKMQVCTDSLQDITLLHLYPDTTPAPETELYLKTVRSFADALMPLRLGLDAITQRIGSGDTGKLQDYTSITYRAYFRLQRLCSHISIAGNLAQNSLPFRPVPVDLGETLRSLTDSLSYLFPSVKSELSITPGSYTIMADEFLLEVALLNLITNSLQHRQENSRIQLSLSHSGSRFILSVDDNGSGITPGVYAHLFDGCAPLELTDSSAGAGLGLTVARGIIERHGGSLLVESRPDRGSRCRTSLPAKPLTEAVFRQADTFRDVKGMSIILTELSVVLPSEYYNEKFFD